MTFFLNTYTEDETIALGERLAQLLEGGDVVLLDGDLGAGKTRFSKGIARGLGVKQELTSPTFNLVLEYPLCPEARDSLAVSEEDKLQSNQANASDTRAARKLCHFDLYRLDFAEQLDDLDYFGIIESQDTISLVEWGSKFTESMPIDYMRVNMTVDTDNPQQRVMEFSAEGTRSKQILARLTATEEARAHG